MGRNSSLERLHAWLLAAPPGTSVPASALLEVLDQPAPTLVESPDVLPLPDLTWRGKLWLVPAETRIGVTELTEALGRPKSWVYRHTSDKAVAAGSGPMLPHRKLGGELVFVVGELRAWIRASEEVVVSGPMESTATERRMFGVIDNRGAA